MDSKVIAGPYEYQQCNQGASCTIGEFLYDDSYVPIATATCNFTSRYPDGSIFINSQTMSVASDGWYSYLVQATGSAGLYRSQVCCTTTNNEYLCLDKSYKVATQSSTLTKTDVADSVWNAQRSSYTASGSFGEALQNIVPSTSDIASAVWGYSGRTLSAFGTLPSDIWSYSTRTLTSFGTLIADLWNHSSRTLTSGGGSTTNNYTTNNYTNSNNTTTNNNSIDTSTFAKKTDVDSLKNEVLYNQTLLEKLANKPIIENSLEEDKSPDVQAKLEETQAALTTLFVNSYSLDSKLGLIDVKWKDTDSKSLLSQITDLSNMSGLIQSSIQKIKGAWNISLAENLSAQADVIKNRLDIIQNGLTTDGKSRIVYDDVKSLMLTLDGLIQGVGTSNDKSNKQTLFAEVKKIKERADLLDLSIADVDKLLANWNSYQFSDIQKRANYLESNLSKINELPRSNTVFSSVKIANESLEKQLMNKVLSIKGTIVANKRLLARKSDKPFSSSWLEMGSIIFKILMTNPSSKISQSVPVKYCLPAEVKQENIIQADDRLTVKYDVEKKQLCASGEYSLEPLESKIMQIRVEDVWVITQNQLESLRRQADELTKPLARTSFFGQGVTIKSNIDVALDKLSNNLKSALTPESKIKTYYEAQIEIKAVQDQIKKLQDLVAQAGSAGSLVGFVGGAQAVSVWGLIIIMVAGFVFLVLYMRVLKGKEEQIEEPVSKKKKKIKEIIKPESSHSFGRTQMIRFATIFFLLGSASSLLTSFAFYKLTGRSTQQNKVEAKVEEKIISPIPLDDKKPENKKTNVQVLGASEKKQTITIKNLYGDYLKIRSTPNGEMIGKAFSEETYTLVKEEGDWIQIELKDGAGWISKEFTSVSK